LTRHEKQARSALWMRIIVQLGPPVSPFSDFEIRRAREPGSAAAD